LTGKARLKCINELGHDQYNVLIEGIEKYQ